MKIILDAMGGDNAPDAVVRGALEAAKEFGVQIVLVGRGADILASMKAQGWDTLPDGVELANAEDVVDMHCDPAAVVKQHPNSSLVLGARMLAQGGGDASAGDAGVQQDPALSAGEQQRVPGGTTGQRMYNGQKAYLFRRKMRRPQGRPSTKVATLHRGRRIADR